MAIGGAIQYAETMTNPEPRWANLKETADHVRLHPRTIQRLAAAGTITAHRNGGATRYDLNEVDAVFKNAVDAGAVIARILDAGTEHAGAADVIARIRAALPQGAGRPLIPLVQVHAILDKVAKDLGVES